MAHRLLNGRRGEPVSVYRGFKYRASLLYTKIPLRLATTKRRRVPGRLQNLPQRASLIYFRFRCCIHEQPDKGYPSRNRLADKNQFSTIIGTKSNTGLYRDECGQLKGVENPTTNLPDISATIPKLLPVAEKP